MLRPTAERTARVTSWRARHPGRTPPVDIQPPGLAAPAMPTKAAVRVVREVLEQHRQELANIDGQTMAELKPIFAKAERELADKLRRWVEQTPDGEWRWSAQHYRDALLQARAIRSQLAEATGEAVTRSSSRVTLASIRHLVDEVARFSEVFTGTPQRIRLDYVKALARGESYIIPRIRSSLSRYSALGDTGTSIYEDIRQRLAVDILEGSSIHETTQKLVESAGPRGWVATRGIPGEDLWAQLEYIPEGLFVRYRYWAERIVRTENAAAAGFVRREGLKQAAKQVPGLRRKWMADGSSCAVICRPLDGVISDIGGTFPTPRGSVDHEPAHPNCTCTTTPWKDDWPDILGDLSPAFRNETTAGAPPAGSPPAPPPAPPTPAPPAVAAAAAFSPSKLADELLRRIEEYDLAHPL